MKSRTNITIVLSSLLLAALGAGCSEWTEPESLDLNKPSVEEQDPALYAAYLANLREWKASEHAVVMATFDNSTVEPTSRAHHIASLPDSLDIVWFARPELAAWQAEEMRTVRERKGTRFVCAVDCAAIEAAWEAQQTPQPEADADADTEEAFAAFVAERMADAFAACTQWGYDGLTVWYTGRRTGHMTPEELAAYTARQEAFMAPLRTWVAANGEKLFLFGGDPASLVDRTILASADYLLLDTDDATGVDMLTYIVLSNLEEGIPSDRFVVTVRTVTAGDTEAGGYFGKQMALPLVAEWVTLPSAEFTRAGMLIRDVQRDFYDAALIYKHTREAIDLINPSPKN